VFYVDFLVTHLKGGFKKSLNYLLPCLWEKTVYDKEEYAERPHAKGYGVATAFIGSTVVVWTEHQKEDIMAAKNLADVFDLLLGEA